MRDAGPRGAFGGRGRRVPVLELRSGGVAIDAGDAPGGEPAVEEGEVGGEEARRDRAGVGHLRPGGVRLVVVDVVSRAGVSRRQSAGRGVSVAPVGAVAAVRWPTAAAVRCVAG